MSAKHKTIFKGLASVLSIVFAGLLIPTIIGRYGLLMSMMYAGLGVGFIWLAFFGIGQFVTWAVEEELKNRAQQQKNNFNNNN